MNQSFLFFELIGIFIVHWLILEPQTYVVVEQFGAENIPLLSGRLVKKKMNKPGPVQVQAPLKFQKTKFFKYEKFHLVYSNTRTPASQTLSQKFELTSTPSGS